MNKLAERVLPDFSLIEGRIGLFGGSFDPVQLGHTAVASAALEQLRLDHVVLIPTKQNPLKQDGPQASPVQRVEMILRAIQDIPDLLVSTYEIERFSDVPDFTVFTLEHVRESVGAGAELFLLIGSDHLETLHQWRDLERYPDFVDGIGVISREENLGERFPLLASKLPGPIQDLIEPNRVELPPIPISSSEVRQLLVERKPANEFLHPEVEEYIREHQIYSERSK